MRKFLKSPFIPSLLVIMLLMAGLVGCASDNDGTAGNGNGGSSEEVYEMKIAHGYPETTLHGINSTYFAQKVEELTEGRVKVSIFANAQLGAADKELDMVKANTVQASYTVSPILEGVNPLHGIFTIPFMFDAELGDGEFLRAADNNPDIQGAIAKKAEELGFKCLGNMPTGFSNFIMANNVKPITKPGDAQGLKIRFTGGDQYRSFVEAMGGNAITVAGAEVPVALSQGVVDGLMSSLLHFDSARWHTKYLTLPSYNTSDIQFYFNLDWWNSLPEDIQDIIENEAMPAAKDEAYRAVAERELARLEGVQEEFDVQVDYMDLDDPEIRKWAEETRQKGIDIFVANTGEEGQALVDAVLAARKEAGKW